jgi:DNA polymerase III delta prime subunit
MESNYQLDLAKQYVEQTHRNLFLTGKAGTGKTTFLKNITETLFKRFVVLAPTGVAALNAKGVTIHSFFQLDFTPFVPYFNNRHNGTKIRKEKLNIIRSLDLVIIDEISMVRADVLDAVDDVLQKVRHSSQPFGGVQLLLIGDLRQLPPVAKDDEWRLLSEHYQTPYFFSSHALQRSDFVTIELEKVFRQSDERFIQILNAVRENKITKETINILNERYIPDFHSNKQYIQLCTHNYQAKEINDERLAEIQSKSYFYEAEIDGDFPEHIYPNDKSLELKTGSQVMFTKNEVGNGKRRYYNGKLGRVVELTDEYIIVEDDDKIRIRVHKDTWRNYRYRLNKNTQAIEQDVIGTFTQYPLKLAWAITIHKSQGLTFERAIIDSNNAFANGQVYVALSRCRSLEGLVLTSLFNPSSVMIDFKVSNFNDEQEANQPDQTTLAADRDRFTADSIRELFDFTDIGNILERLYRLNAEDISRFYAAASEKTGVDVVKIRDAVVVVGHRFGRQIESLCKTSDYYFKERIAKGTDYFINELNAINNLVSLFRHLDFDNQEITKNLSSIVNDLCTDKEIKNRLLKAIHANGFDVLAYIDLRNNLYAKGDKLKFESFNAEEAQKEDIKNQELYDALRQWRLEVSKEINKPAYVVLSQKALLNIANQEPKSLRHLAKIKGIGQKTFDNYGLAIMEIIVNNTLIQ